MVSGQSPSASLKNHALILADSNVGNMGMLLRDLLRKFSWKGAESNYPDCSFEEISGHIRQGHASCIIIDDYEQQPSPFVLRRLLADHVTLYTPTLVLLNDANLLEMESINLIK